ncbi:DUF881 domain-containing protein [Lederbergia sp. NSJ-179]|uniref:DUF881 domain-containing protein n=1 Tax=Lederbergia sp. NSJ-179 TaxID=2931402 RepID=UPI001FD0C57D|nr:DUF881 domain-containing protein [Lederbergia sp. NSJ-179]MCJ7839555.1 DUF881 domain-containing protein [Lederbergia sp. NSJ-179]
MRRVRGKYVIFSFVFLIFGFILAFSYSQAGKDKHLNVQITDKQYRMEKNLRNQLISIQGRNQELQNELYEKQDNVRQIEKELFQEEEYYHTLAADAEKYRMFLGKVKVKGPGVEILLEDGEYKKEEDANNYLVHEHHVFKVVNELIVSGASAIAINGQRLKSDSYIVCSGPVITVDGNPFPAPFKITALGDADALISAVTLKGGARDQIVNDNIMFTIEKKKQIVLDPVLGEST